MKKVFCILLAMMCLLPALAIAEVNWAAMTVEEIQAEIDRARAEIITREIKTNEKGTVILDAEGLVVSITKIELKEDTVDGYNLWIEYTIINNTEKKLQFSTEAIYLNGWKLDSNIITTIDAGMKAKELDIFFHVEDDADVSSYEEMEDLKFIMRANSSDPYKVLIKSSESTIYFK